VDKLSSLTVFKRSLTKFDSLQHFTFASFRIANGANAGDELLI